MIRNEHGFLCNLSNLQHIEYFELFALLNEIEDSDRSGYLLNKLASSEFCHVMLDYLLSAFCPFDQKFEISSFINAGVVACVER